MLETVNLGNSLWLVKSQKGVDLWPNDLINFYIPNCTQAFCLRREFFFFAVTEANAESLTWSECLEYKVVECSAL